MTLFGILSTDARQSAADAFAYGAEIAGRLAGTAQQAAMLWAEQTAQAPGILLALEGCPYWRSATRPTPTGAIDAPNAQPGVQAAELLDAYRTHGVAFLSRLAGTYAIVVIEPAEMRVLLAVDPMGIGRLTYAVSQGAVVFGSSAEQVAHCPSVRAGIDNQALFDYLMMHMVSAPATIFSGVKKLPPATYALFERGALRTSRYWTPDFSPSRAPVSKLRDELFDVLRDSVRQAAPDTATGAFLSGGLDSSSVAGVLSEVGPKPAKTFSIGFGYADYDELDYARIANARFGCAGHEHVIHGNDIVESFARIARAYDEPFGNSSALPAYYCAMLAKQNGVTHLLAGDGGDELFAGNSRYADQQVFEYYRSVPRLLRGLIEPVINHWPSRLDMFLTRKARGYIAQANIPLPARLENWNLVQRLGVTQMLHDSFLSEIDTQAPFRHMQDVWDSTPSDVQLHRMLYYDWHYTLADNDLRKVQTMCALAGVRVSYPMLHYSVVDLSARIPHQVMMPGRKLRHFYKHAMQGFLPDAIIHKKKHGFGLPFGLWLQESPALRELIFGNLSSLRRRHIVRDSFIDRLLGLHGADDARYYGVLVWVLAMLEQWLQEHRISS